MRLWRKSLRRTRFDRSVSNPNHRHFHEATQVKSLCNVGLSQPHRMMCCFLFRMQRKSQIRDTVNDDLSVKFLITGLEFRNIISVVGLSNELIVCVTHGRIKCEIRNYVYSTDAKTGYCSLLWNQLEEPYLQESGGQKFTVYINITHTSRLHFWGTDMYSIKFCYLVRVPQSHRSPLQSYQKVTELLFKNETKHWPQPRLFLWLDISVPYTILLICA